MRRHLTTTYATNVYTQSQYDCCTLEWIRDEDGRKTYYAYDDPGRVSDMWTDISGQSQTAPLVHYEYDDFGNVHTVTTYSDGSTGRETTYSYDLNNRVTEIDHPSPLGTEKFAYDEVGDLKGKMDGEGAITAYEYDDLNRLVKVDYNHSCTWPNIVYPLTADVTYTYYGGSRLKETMVEASLGTSYYDYDLLDRLTSYTPRVPGTTEVTYAYNGLNQKTSVSTTGLGTVNYEYYANGWLKSVLLGAAPVAGYGYDQVGNRTDITLGNGVATAYAYDTDPRYRIESITHTPTVGDPLTIDYTRDGAGNPTEIESVTYDYDANSRLTDAGATSYTYDWVGNRVTPGNMIYGGADELQRWPNNHRYTYYGTGSLEYQKDDSSNIQKIYGYTPANLLDSVVHAGIGTSSMAWDADSNRVSFTSSTGGTTQFVYDITAGIPAVIEEMSTGDPEVYIREPDGSLIAMFRDGVYPFYYHFDALGSTRLLTDESGTITDTYSYDAWGNTSHDSGSTQQPYQYVGQLGYYTHWQDENLPLLQLGVRLYDPALGRFTQRDPLILEAGGYRYAGLQPTTGVDPSGMAYMKFDGKQVCLYHDNGKVWLCCGAQSGIPGKVPPTAPGTYRLDPKDICCVKEGYHPMWSCSTDAWGNWRCHLQPVKIKPGCEDQPHEECFLHGGCSGRSGTLGCIRIPDQGKGSSNCLEKLMRLLRGIGTPVGLDVCY